MTRCFAVFALSVVAFVPGVTAPAQEANDLAELQFVRALRARQYNDLALEYLERLRKGKPSAELLRELPLEFAKTRLDGSNDEPDSGRRLAIFDQARAEIEAFLKDNPNHPRAGEARLDVARVVTLQATTQLSRARAEETVEARAAEGVKARQKFVDAEALLQKAADEIEGMIRKAGEPKTDAERQQRAKLENDRMQARLALALNLMDQAETYLDETKVNLLLERSKQVQGALKILQSLAAADVSNPICWQAAAWLGNCLDLNGDPPRARAKLFEVINSALPASSEGRRLARYFRTRIQYEEPLEEEKTDAKLKGTLINEANSWLASYPTYARTPEGIGMRYLLARMLRERAGDPKTPPLQKEGDLTRARALLKEVEHTENDFTDRARRLKIGIIRDQGGFTRKVESLTTFEDCYVRAQHEILASGEDAKPDSKGVAPDPKKLEETRKARVDTILAALRRGLTMPDAKPDNGKVAPEVNNARAMLAFYYLNRERYRETIEAGEGFARDDPRSAQAAMAAVYALQAYARLISQRERENALPEELQPDREKMLALARYVEERWPKEVAGNMARHQIALALLREQKQARDAAAQVRLLGEAIAELSAIGRTYPSYILSQYQLADTCLQAERDGIDPLPGKKAGDYRLSALAVLTALPEPDADADPAVGQAFALGKIKLAWELYKDKRFDEMIRLGDGLAKKMAALPMEEAAREQMKGNVTDIRLFANASLAEADSRNARYAEVAKRLDDLVTAINAPDTNAETKVVAAELKKNLQLGSALLGLDLRANVQLGKLDRVEPILKALQSLTAEGDDPGGVGKILQTLVFVIRQQIDELDKKGDKDNRDKAIAGFTHILDKFAEKPDKLDTRSRLLLAQCYSNMGGHRKAADLLEKLATPTEKGAQLLYARELRLAKDLDKARQVLDSILGTTSAPGWGARNVDVLIEDVSLIEDEGNYDRAAQKANDIVRKLLPTIARDNALKEKYFEAYYHVVYSFVKYGQGLSDTTQKGEALRRAAIQALELEKKWPDYGSDLSAKRFNELMNKEADFKELVEKLRANDK